MPSNAPTGPCAVCRSNDVEVVRLVHLDTRAVAHVCTACLSASQATMAPVEDNEAKAMAIHAARTQRLSLWHSEGAVYGLAPDLLDATGDPSPQRNRGKSIR